MQGSQTGCSRQQAAESRQQTADSGQGTWAGSAMSGRVAVPYGVTGHRHGLQCEVRCQGSKGVAQAAADSTQQTGHKGRGGNVMCAAACGCDRAQAKQGSQTGSSRQGTTAGSAMLGRVAVAVPYGC